MIFEFICYKLLSSYEHGKKEDFENADSEPTNETEAVEQNDSGDTSDAVVGGAVGVGVLGVALLPFFMWLLQVMIFIFAIYISFQRNDGFDALGFLAACCYPICYLLYAFFSPIEVE